MRKCSQCGIEKPLSDFHLNSKSKDGRHSYCKECACRRARDPMRSRKHIVKKYGLTEKQYDDLFEKQNGRCAICKGTQARFLSIDHDHLCCPGNDSCGKCVRGLLCKKCNTAIGFFADSQEHLISALKYLGLDIESQIQTAADEIAVIDKQIKSLPRMHLL